MPTDLYALLACPTCKLALERTPSELRCPGCGCRYPMVDGVPVLLPGGALPHETHESELLVVHTYALWQYTNVLRSLTDDQPVLEIGAGATALDDPCIIRMDIVPGPNVDVVGDAHALPFRPGSFALIFSRAVFEHLRQPFSATAEIRAATKVGGYTSHETNFVFPYHGFPNHFFNASEQGLQQWFADFDPLAIGVAPWQMPSFALETILAEYLRGLGPVRSTSYGHRIAALIEEVLSQDLWYLDSRLEPRSAKRIAAGTYFFGRREPGSEAALVPEAIRAHAPPDAVLDLGRPDNVLLWAKGEGRRVHPEIARALDAIVPFDKRGSASPADRGAVAALPLTRCDQQFTVNPRTGQPFRGFVERRVSSSLPGFVARRVASFLPGPLRDRLRSAYRAGQRLATRVARG